jgi:hypothetical protein
MQRWIHKADSIINHRGHREHRGKTWILEPQFLLPMESTKFRASSPCKNNK